MKYLDTERQSALQRALNNCSMWYQGYQNGGTNWAFCAAGSWGGWGVQRTRQLGSRINEDSKGARSPRTWKGREKGENINTQGTNNVQGMAEDARTIERQLRLCSCQYGKYLCHCLDQAEVGRGAVLLGVLIPNHWKAGLLQLVRSFNKGRGGPALLVGLFRFPVLIRLSKWKAAFQWEFTSPWSCFPPFLKYLLFLCVYIQWKFPVHCLDWCPDHMFALVFFFCFFLFSIVK